jgi:hypothetical protein
MSLSSSSRMSMGGRKLLTIFYLRQKKIVEKKLIDRPRHASLLHGQMCDGLGSYGRMAESLQRILLCFPQQTARAPAIPQG